MRLRIMSDLHLEFHRDKGVSFCKSLKPDGDVLVLAGDIIPLAYLDHDQVKEAIAYLTISYKHVIWVPGNHEYYGISLGQGTKYIDYLGAGGIHMLVNGERTTIENQSFVGGTFWYPFGPQQVLNKHGMNDFNLIKEDFSAQLNDLHFGCFGNLLRHTDKDSVVITHMLPGNFCVNEQYRGSALNCFFVSDGTEIIDRCRPKLWVYGHTHSSADIQMEGWETRFLCNPAGYRGENKQFNENCIVEV